MSSPSTTLDFPSYFDSCSFSALVSCSSSSPCSANVRVCAQSCMTLHDLMDQSPRLFCPWDFPGKNTGVGYHALLQGVFLTWGLNPTASISWETRMKEYHGPFSSSSSDISPDSKLAYSAKYSNLHIHSKYFYLSV